MDAVPSPESLSDDDLPALLDQDAPRQVLHVSYGTLLRDSQIAPLIRETLLRYEEQYTNNLLNHFQRHLETLGVPRRPDHETPPAAD